MVAPIADRCPGIFGIRFFPFDPGLGDAIGVVTIGGGSVEELRNRGIEKLGIAQAKRFPILKDVAPVTFIGEAVLALAITEADTETIPRATRIAMAATEGERQIGRRDAREIRIFEGGDPGE